MENSYHQFDYRRGLLPVVLYVLEGSLGVGDVSEEELLSII